MDPNNSEPSNPILNPNPETTPTPGVNLELVSEPKPDLEPTIGVPVEPVVPNLTPANPVINSGVGTTAANQNGPMSPVVQSSEEQGLAATDPIMQPEPAPEPDPIEEELKAPMKANDPVPGSIGSAVSGPEENSGSTDSNSPTTNPFSNNTQEKATNVSFNDPATQPDAGGMNANSNSPKNKTNKNTLIALIAVVAVIIIALVVVLIMQATSGNGQTSNNTSNTSVAVEEEPEEEPEEEYAGGDTLSCSRNMTADELQKNDGASSGIIEIGAEFDENDILNIIHLKEFVMNEESGGMDEVSSKDALVEDIESFNGSDFSLVADASGKFDLSFAAIQERYESLAFECEVL